MRPFRSFLAVAIVGLCLLGLSACGDDDDATESAGTTATTASTAAAGKSHTEASEAELEEWQKDLNAVGCWAGAVDGTLGPQTEQAIKEFQAAEGLTVDGKLGPQTEQALADAAAAGKTVCTSSDTTSTTTAGSGSTTISVSSASYSKMFTVTSCTPTQGGTTGVVLVGTAEGGLTLSIDAPSGTGSIAISGGSEQDGINLSGNVTKATVSDADVNVSGTFSDGEAFTASGYCA